MWRYAAGSSFLSWRAWWDPLVIAGLWAATEPIVALLNPEIDGNAVGDYSRLSIPSIALISLSYVCSAQLIALQSPVAPMLIEVGGAVVDIAATYTLVITAGLGLRGSALAMLVQQVVAAPAYLFVTSDYACGLCSGRL